MTQNITSKANAAEITDTACTRQAGNTSESILNDISHTVYSLHRVKQISKWVYNNLMKLVIV